MNFYETVSILQDTSLQGVKAATDEFKSILTNMRAVVIKHEYWGLRQLAYPINRNKRGHYIMLAIQAFPEAIFELERNYKIKENVIRFLTLRVKKIESGPSFMMQTMQSQFATEKTTQVEKNVTEQKETVEAEG